jgi:hypothetical protein
LLEVVFDQMPPLVHFRVVENLRLAIGLRRVNSKRASFVQFNTYGVAIECTSLGFFRRWNSRRAEA